MADISFVSYPDDIRKASTAATDIGDALAGLTGSGPMRAAAAAMPGGTSCPKLAALADDWSQLVTALRGRVSDHAEALRESAASYVEIDTAITAAMNDLCPCP